VTGVCGDEDVEGLPLRDGEGFEADAEGDDAEGADASAASSSAASPTQAAAQKRSHRSTRRERPRHEPEEGAPALVVWGIARTVGRAGCMTMPLALSGDGRVLCLGCYTPLLLPPTWRHEAASVQAVNAEAVNAWAAAGAGDTPADATAFTAQAFTAQAFTAQAFTAPTDATASPAAPSSPAARARRLAVAATAASPAASATLAPALAAAGVPTASPRSDVELFCGGACRAVYFGRRHSASLRRQLASLDGAVCASCGLDAGALCALLTEAPPGAARSALLQQLAPSIAAETALAARLLEAPHLAGHAWHADHRLAVRDGGGECTVENMQVLCVACHIRKTRAEASAAAAARRQARRSARDS
jgi:hypothetical protein